jgi:release factor glutamine methyltransferase
VPRVADVASLARHLRVDIRDAEELLAHALNRDRTWILAHPEWPVTPTIAHRVTTDLLKRARGYPLAYLTGEQEFFGLPFRITPSVLIPRPETELLVEEALRRIPSRSPLRVADIGTGSGCIAVSLAVHRPRIRVEAIDQSAAALAVARANAKLHRVARRIRFIHGNLLAPLAKAKLDAVVANLPYLPAGKLPRFEPRGALYGGPDGLRFIRTLLRQIERRTAPLRFVLLEIDPRTVRALQRYLPAGYTRQFHRDLAGRVRILELTPTA